MRFYLDTEFIDDGKTIDLISIGIVSEDGREFYAESTEFDASKADSWVKANVIDALWSRQEDKTKLNRWTRDIGKGGLLTRREIGSELALFCGSAPEFWGEWCAYDWVVVGQLFGKLIDIPDGFPYRCNDVIQFKEQIDPAKYDSWPASKEVEGNHHALSGAFTVKDRYEWCLRESEVNG